MKITGKFSLKDRVDPREAEAVDFLNGVIKELVADPANGLTIDIDAANRDEAKAKVKWLNKIAKAMKGEKQLELKLADEPSVQAEATLKARKHKSKKGGKKGLSHKQARNVKAAMDAASKGAIATLPPPEAIKALGKMGNKMAVQMIKATVENPALSAMVDPQLNKLGLTKEQYIALLDEELK
jgi:hypothetical protein